MRSPSLSILEWRSFTFRLLIAGWLLVWTSSHGHNTLYGRVRLDSLPNTLKLEDLDRPRLQQIISDTFCKGVGQEARNCRCLSLELRTDSTLVGLVAVNANTNLPSPGPNSILSINSNDTLLNVNELQVSLQTSLSRGELQAALLAHPQMSADPRMSAIVSSLRTSPNNLHASIAITESSTPSPSLMPTSVRKESVGPGGNQTDIGFAIGLVIGIAVGIAILLCWIFFFYLYCCKPRRPRHQKVDPNSAHGSPASGRQLQSIFTVSQKPEVVLDNKVNANINRKASSVDVQLFQMGNSFSNSARDEEEAEPRNDIVMYDLSCKPPPAQ